MLGVACIYAALRSRLWNFLPPRMQQLLRQHFWRWAKYTLAGISLFAIGSSLLYIEVHHFDFNKLIAHWVNTPVLMPLGFALNWFIWKERKTPWASGVKRYALVTGGTIACSQGLYALLAGPADIQYLRASALTAIVVGVPHYILNDKGVFKRNKEAAMA